MQNREHQISTMENENNFFDCLTKFATLYHWVTCYTQYLRKNDKIDSLTCGFIWYTTEFSADNKHAPAIIF